MNGRTTRSLALTAPVRLIGATFGSTLSQNPNLFLVPYSGGGVSLSRAASAALFSKAPVTVRGLAGGLPPDPELLPATNTCLDEVVSPSPSTCTVLTGDADVGGGGCGGRLGGSCPG